METFTFDQADQFDKDMFDLEQIQRRIEDGYYESYDDYVPMEMKLEEVEDYSGATEGDR